MKLSKNDSIEHNMTLSIERILQAHPRPYLTDSEIEALLEGTPNSRYGKVKRLIAQGKLLHIRRGVYCLTEQMGCLAKPHPFELAQYIYGPSYISLESALSYHKLIPESVYTITSATGRRSNEFDTPLGVFRYARLPLKELFTEVELIHDNGHSFLMAKPWKAICDYVYCYKKNWVSIQPLLESLRIQLDELPALQDADIQLLDEYYQHARVSRFLHGVQKEFK